MTETLIKWALGPLLLAQGAYVRRKTPLLPEPEGARHGQDGAGTPLRLLILGDSAAAGVGVAHQSEALAGQTARLLTGRFILRWRLIARTGATTASTLAHLGKREAETFDVVIISLGVNDVTSGRETSAWLAEQAALLDLLRQKFGARLILLSGLPPMGLFPALPQPLRWYLGRRAQGMNAALERLAAPMPDCLHVSEHNAGDAYAASSQNGATPVTSLMASDGFHPGPAVYKRWAETMVQRILERYAA